MRRVLKFAMEQQLEIEKLHERKKLANRTGQAAVLYDELYEEKKIKEEKAQKQEEENSSTDTSAAPAESDAPPEEGADDQAPEGGGEDQPAEDAQSDDPPDEAQDDPPQDDTKDSDESKEPEKKDDKKPEPKKDDKDDKEDTPKEEESALESLTDLTYSAEEATTKDYIQGAGYVAGAIFDGVSAVARFAVAVAYYFGRIGVEYGPRVLSHLGKGVLWVITRLIKLTLYTTESVSKFIERRRNSVDSLLEDVKKLKEALDHLPEEPKEIAETDLYSRQSVIRTLKIGQSVDMVRNMQVLQDFSTKSMAELDKRIKDEMGVIKHIMLMAQDESDSITPEVLGVKRLSGLFQQGSVKGYDPQDEALTCEYFPKVLPSDIVVIGYLPKEDLQEFHQLQHAYNHSKLFLGVSVESYHEIESMPYLDRDKLLQYLTILEQTIAGYAEQQKDLESLARLRETLKYGIKGYVINLLHRSAKPTKEETLVDYVYLKTMFMDKVYMKGLLDISDYTGRILRTAVTFAEHNVKKLS